MPTSQVLFGYIVDGHNGMASGVDHNEPEIGRWPDDYDVRWYSNGPTRRKAFADDMTARGNVDFCIDGGDMIDDRCTDVEAELAEAEAAFSDNCSVDMHYVLGNWEVSEFKADWTKYTAIIDQTPPGGGNFWTTGKPATWPATTAYSFDVNGVHFVVIGEAETGWSDAEKAALVTWLAADLAATSYPCVVFSHRTLDSQNIGVLSYHAVRNDGAWGNGIRTTMEASGKVQLVMTGHRHPSPESHPYRFMENDIVYLRCRANCIGPVDGSTPQADDAAYYVVGFTPSTHAGTNQERATIHVECNYNPKEQANKVERMTFNSLFGVLGK